MPKLRGYVKGEGFSDLGVNPAIVKVLCDLSIRVPTCIQAKCIPEILAGKNVIASAKTGSGKTLAFVIPIVQDLLRDPYGVFALVLTPTRELALQIGDQFQIVSVPMNFRQAIVIGGLDMASQLTKLEERPHVIVATPGRLAETILNNVDSVWLNKLRYLVMDEADKLLEPSFERDLEIIFQKLPKKKPRLILLSATMSPKMRNLTLGNTSPSIFDLCEKLEPVDTVEQKYILMNTMVRDTYLHYVLKILIPGKTCIIFATKRKTCEYLRLLLSNLGIAAVALHGNMKQAERMASIAKFKASLVKILITTDLGSRGLDISHVDVVINYQLPLDTADYIHRIGRTARMGAPGTSISLVSQYDINILLEIEKNTKCKMTELETDESVALKLLNETSASKRTANALLEDLEFDRNKHAKRAKITDLAPSQPLALNPR